MAEQVGIPSIAVIDRVIELQPARLLQIEDFTYIDKDKSATLFTPPVPSTHTVRTLTGFVDLLEAKFEEFEPAHVLVCVTSHEAVFLIDASSDMYGRRQTYIKVELIKPEREFKFNEYIPQEQFVIQMRSLFQQDSNLDDLVKLAGNLAQNSEARQEDDGFTQRVSMKTGIVMAAERTIAPRVTLTPFRTFREAKQPSSEYVFRVKHDERQGNMCALFEADGGMWKLSAIENVKEWLSNQLKGSDIDGLPNIPIIA